MSLRMLMDVDFGNLILFQKTHDFLAGFVAIMDITGTPIHLPVSMDTVMSGSYWRALIALYKQLRRWAWGVENFPYMMEAFLQDRQMPWHTKVRWLFKQLEGMYTWATAPFLIFILGYLPFLVAPESFRAFTIFQNTPFTLQWLMRLSMIGLFVSATLALTLLPPLPRGCHGGAGLILIQWLLLPVIASFALSRLTPKRLMLGRYLGSTSL